MWIDAHHHVWDPGHRPQPWMDPNWPINRPYSLEDYGEAVHGTPVSSSIVVQTAPSLAETVDLLALAEHRPSVAGVVGWIDLLAPLGPQLDLLAASPGARRLVGFRHQAEDETDPDWHAQAEVIAAVRELGRRGFTYDLLVRPHQLPAATTLARATASTTRLILDHCGKPPVGEDLRAWNEGLRQLALSDNVACKISGLVTEADWSNWSLADLAPIVDAALAAFGPSRLMFGSDWPVCLLAASYADVLETATTLLPHAAAAEVFAATATRWYQLDPGEGDRR